MAGNKLFGVDIAAEIHRATKGNKLLSATLHKVSSGTRTPGALTGGTNPTEADYAADGFIDSKNRRYVNGTLVKDGEELIVLIGDSIASGAVPAEGDKVTIESTKYEVLRLGRDPAKATYELVCKSE